MNLKTIEDVYLRNDEVRRQLKQTVEDLSDAEANFLPEGEKWTVAQIVEHIALVESGVLKISVKLLNEAKSNGKNADGNLIVSKEFLQIFDNPENAKLQAPEIVHPRNNKTIAESLAKLEEIRMKLKEIRPLFETVECSDFKFPHPIFGDLTTHEWLALVGGHEARHINQIKRILEKQSA